LGIFRNLGRKREEPDLYELYAQLLAQQGHYEQSLRMWNLAFELCETLKFHFRALHMLLGISTLQSQTGHREELNSTWARIEAFMQHNQGMPDVTMLRYYMARLEYLKIVGDQKGL